MSIRVLLIAIFLIPITSLWMMTASLWNAGYPTTVSLFFNVIFYMFIIIVINRLIASVSPKKALTRKELALLYPMLTVSASVNGLDMLQLIGAVIAGPNFLATPENEWKELFIKYIPQWLMVSDKSSLDQYAQGDSSFFTVNNINAWLAPALLWSAFTVSLILVMLGLTLALSSRWVSEEKLSYPIIQLPLQMTEPRFLKNKVMWIGVGIGFFMGALNGLHFFLPNIPTIGRPVDIGRYFTEKPLNAIGWLPIAVQPFAIGLGFFMPIDLSFSCWFFYLFWKFEKVLTSMLGINISGFPFINEQTTGAYVGFALVSVWVARKSLIKIFRFKNQVSSEKNVHSFALITLLIGLTGITAFCLKAGMGIKAVIIFFTIYFLISISIGRIRAELGSPVHDLHFAGPDMMMVHLMGSRSFRQQDLTIISMFWYFNRAYRSHPMPCILEGIKLGERTEVPATKIATGIIIAAILGIFFAFFMHLQSAYRYGAYGKMWPAYETFGRLSSWLTTPTGGDFTYISAYSIGALSVVAMSIFRTHFIWFPLHPVGFVVSSTWGMNPFWFSVFLSWAIKYSILKYGGLRTYRKNMPLFLGLILGEFIADAGVSIAGTLMRVQTYIWYG
jgi:hypothetical protein